MRKIKKLVALLLAFAIVFGLVGCGKKKNTAANSFEDNDEFYTIEWYMLFPDVKQKDVAPVQAKLNKYLKEKINAEVHMNVFDWSTYSERLNLMMQSGEKIDLCWTSGTDYYNTVAKSGFIELDDMMKKYTPKLFETIDKNILNGSKVNGKMYAVPANKEAASALGVVYRKDITDKLGINMEDCKTAEDVMEVCKKVHVAYPDMFMTSTSTPSSPVDWLTLDFDTAYLGYGKWLDNDDGKLINFYETQEYQDACRYAYDLRQIKGFYPSGSGKTTNELLGAGQQFCMVSGIKPGKANEYNILFNNPNIKYSEVILSEPVTRTSECTGSMMAIPITCENPVRTLKFLELLNTDEYVNNLINFGIEGEGYTKNDDGTIHVIGDASYKCNGNQWMIGNVFINYITDEEDPQKNEKFKEFNRQAKPSDMLGFAFDVEPVKNEAIAVSNVIKEYNDQLKTGSVPLDKNYDTFVKKMKKAGSDTVLAEVQKQYDQWRENNK